MHVRNSVGTFGTLGTFGTISKKINEFILCFASILLKVIADNDDNDDNDDFDDF